jgi:DNA-binding MarR family transcriptional regulator
MNSIFFGLKRAHHGVLRVTRRALAHAGLTAARFDLMYVVHERDGIQQRLLRRALGVSAPTVTRMLGSLEELGLLRRVPSTIDRRQRLVLLTEVGRRCIRKAISRLVRSGAAQLAVDSALCANSWWSESACLLATDRCESTLNAFRSAYRDVATLYYRWHPDD